MNHKRNWIIGVALSATAVFAASQIVNAPTQDETISNAEILFTETFEPASGDCYFNWAYRDAPEITKKVDTAVKLLNPDSSAYATLFGEDCIYADGSSTFGVMETDFTVRLPVDDLTQHGEFGNWVKQVMQIIIEIPREELQGNYGFVEFKFEKSETETIIFRVPIQQYLDEAQEKTDAELFNYFYSQP
ncbi:MAG: hypothetical protein HC797_05070 [Anaerolineales bacterium]|nr:hypothetical protein [Anaerolineales bacterium]